MKEAFNFGNFESTFTKTKVEPTIDVCEIESEELSYVFNVYGGSTFDFGLYRIHNYNTSVLWNVIIEECFSSYVGKIDCFGFDWYGRQYAIDKKDKSIIYMFDCAAFEEYKLKTSLQAFHDDILVENKFDTLLEDEFKAWRNTHLKVVDFEECVGFKKPLFMGGEESMDNLELYEMKFYWELTYQLYNGGN